MKFKVGDIIIQRNNADPAIFQIKSVYYYEYIIDWLSHGKIKSQRKNKIYIDQNFEKKRVSKLEKILK